MKCHSLKTEHFILFRVPANPLPSPPPGGAAKDVCHAIRQRNIVQLQIKNSRRNIAFSVTSILPLQSSIYRDPKSLSL